MLLNTVSLDYTNKVTSWSLLNYCYTCRSALGAGDSQNRIKTRWGNEQIKNGSVEGTGIKPSTKKAWKQLCSPEGFSFRLRAPVGQSFIKLGNRSQQQKGKPTWNFSSSSGGCSFQESPETCHRASGTAMTAKLLHGGAEPELGPQQNAKIIHRAWLETQQDKRE